MVNSDNLSHVLFCALSLPNNKNALKGNPGIYAYPNSGSVEGRQTNEAPIKYLVDKSLGKVARIGYLLSDECKSKEFFVDGLDESITVEEYFKREIYAFAKAKFGVHAADSIEFRNIHYDISDPAKSLHGIVEAMDNDCIVDLDITGGGRDATFLLALVAQIAQYREGAIRLGSVVYADYQGKKIVEQNKTFEIITLSHAIEVFTRYGKAETLVSFVRSIKESSERKPNKLILELYDYLQELGNQLKSFSDNLSICRIENLASGAKRINELGEAIKATFDTVQSRYNSAADALSSMKNANDSIEIHLAEASNILAQCGFETPVSKNDAIAKLGLCLDAYRLDRKAFLFCNELQTFKNGFARHGDNQTDQAVELINWCVSRMMMQQALVLFREFAPNYLQYSKSVAIAVENWSCVTIINAINANDDERKKVIDSKLRDACRDYLADIGLEPYKNRLNQVSFYLFAKDTKSYVKDRALSYDGRESATVQETILWSRYFRLLRNKASHAGLGIKGDLLDQFVEVYGGLKDSDGAHIASNPGIEAIGSCISRAIGVLRKKAAPQIDADFWNESSVKLNGLIKRMGPSRDELDQQQATAEKARKIDELACQVIEFANEKASERYAAMVSTTVIRFSWREFRVWQSDRYPNFKKIERKNAVNSEFFNYYNNANDDWTILQIPEKYWSETIASVEEKQGSFSHLGDETNDDETTIDPSNTNTDSSPSSLHAVRTIEELRTAVLELYEVKKSNRIDESDILRFCQDNGIQYDADALQHEANSVAVTLFGRGAIRISPFKAMAITYSRDFKSTTKTAVMLLAGAPS